jgi:hypothetical protein
MDDAWERQYFGDLSHDGTGDTDHDGMSDLAEFLAGTNPTDAQSALRILPNPTRSGTTVTVQFESVAGKKYRLQYKESLNDSAWSDASGDLLANSATTTATDNAATSASRFYRVALAP